MEIFDSAPKLQKSNSSKSDEYSKVLSINDSSDDDLDFEEDEMTRKRKGSDTFSKSSMIDGK